MVFVFVKKNAQLNQKNLNKLRFVSYPIQAQSFLEEFVQEIK